MLRWMRAGTRLLITITTVAGPPVVAVWWWQRSGGRLPGRAAFEAWVAEPMTGVTLAILLGLAVLAMWLMIVVSVGASALRRVKRRWARVRWMPLPTPAQATATSMAGAAVFGMPAAVVTATAADVVPGSPDQPVPSAPHRLPSVHLAADEHAAVAEAGVDLPDGSWLPAETAHAVTVAAAVGWLRRRRDYQPTPDADSGELQELPSTIAAIQLQALADPDTVRGVAATSGLSAGPPSSLGHLTAAGIGLTGPGAEDAARGVLVTALLTAQRVQVVTTTADIGTLLGHSAAAPPTGLPGLHIAANLDTALAYLTTFETADRALVLLTGVPTADTEIFHLRSVLHAHSFSAVLLGTWTDGATQSIGTDGTATTQTGLRRWCVVSRQTAADLCTLASHANGMPTTSPRPGIIHPDVPPAATPPSRKPEPTAPALALSVLGPPVVTVRGTRIHVRRAAALQTLVLLAVHRDGIGTRRLGTVLWPADPPHTTTGRVYTTVSELRRTLATHAGTPVVVRDGDRYRLDADHIHVDLWHLDQALTTLDGSDPTGHDRIVAGLDTAELAAGQDWPWLEPHRERLRRRLLNALVAAAEHAVPADQQGALRRALAVDDCNEDILRRLITVHARLGDHRRIADLTAAYRSRLADRGMTPSAEFDSFLAGIHRR
jgi:DNA-binding SARP family transcriptional activator